jgi:hypothetical protein
MVQLEGLGKLTKFNDLIGTPVRHLPACSIAPQLSTLPRAPIITIIIIWVKECRSSNEIRLF